MNASVSLTEIDCRPGCPAGYNPPIGLIGCGAITVEHLRAYRQAGLQVRAMCDLRHDLAVKRQQEFFPDAKVFTDYRQLLRDDSIQVVDVTTHPQERLPILRDALNAGKHVLSQKPFVTDLDDGKRLVELASNQGVMLAVNQNGRFAPHFSFLRQAVRARALGMVSAVHFNVYWDHTWVAGTRFEEIRHLILYDFGIHWFDMARCLMGEQEPQSVFAVTRRAPGQTLKPPLLAQALIEFPNGQGSLSFGGFTKAEAAPIDTTLIVGELGTGRAEGPSLLQQRVSIQRGKNIYEPKLTGSWFPDGFQGTMVELLRSIEQKRPCMISAEDNLKSLALCFAALKSADSATPVRVGSVRTLIA